MTAKKSTKREFDWRNYSKPQRLLTPAQETALLGGVLCPLLELALADDGLSLQIRARQAAFYYRGTSLARLSGAEPPFAAQVDANLRLPRAERSGAERLETWPLACPEDVTAFLAEIGRLRTAADEWSADEPPMSLREQLTQLAQANGPHATQTAELIVIDIEYQYGKRRFDFVGMRRATGVGGFGAFSTPRLVIGELFGGDRPANSVASLTSFAAEAAQFAHALTGEHLARAAAELEGLVAQKIRLGLLPADVPFAHLASGPPELLVIFATRQFTEASLDAPLSEMHDRMIARHFPAELLGLAAIGEARSAGNGSSLEALEDDVLSYRAFKGLRRRLRD
jgi:hypothetical protein